MIWGYPIFGNTHIYPDLHSPKINQNGSVKGMVGWRSFPSFPFWAHHLFRCFCCSILGRDSTKLPSCPDRVVALARKIQTAKPLEVSPIFRSIVVPFVADCSPKFYRGQICNLAKGRDFSEIIPWGCWCLFTNLVEICWTGDPFMVSDWGSKYWQWAFKEKKNMFICELHPGKLNFWTPKNGGGWFIWFPGFQFLGDF